MRSIDLPPIWLILFLALTWLSPWDVPWGPALWPGLILVGAGIGLTLAALAEFRRAATSIVPRKTPDALITSGIFRLSRNPIYLADVLVLLGFALMWGKVLGFLLVPLFVVLLDRRFIRGEETRIREEFGDVFEAYEKRTRRWF